MKFLVVVVPPRIYHGCSTRKTFWEGKFTGKKQDLFVSVNMRNYGQLNVRIKERSRIVMSVSL